ncbi:MAG TPA: 3-oxoacyl-ACP reductase family protein [Methylomirabilota bacterium]|jgi:3-oxoacyl-[acyl-carrier protein] reductase|nr:3-oxoacyl-ACP reductase family protein [Methylomirabilota bacterium]
MARLAGKTALVTGGHTGIGRAIALAFAEEGADVAVFWLDGESEAKKLGETIQALGRRAQAVRADVTRESDVRAGVKAVLDALGQLDVLVNNAGIQKAQGITETSVEDWDRMMAVHLRGTFLCCREVVPHMQARGSGKIINMASQLAYTGRARYTAYSAAKGGVLTFTRALAQELAPAIQVNAVAPGLIDTGFDPLPESRKREIAAALPLKRLGRPDDVAPVFVFLASDEARYLCGQTIGPNGGEVMP